MLFPLNQREDHAGKFVNGAKRRVRHVSLLILGARAWGAWLPDYCEEAAKLLYVG